MRYIVDRRTDRRGDPSSATIRQTGIQELLTDNGYDLGLASIRNRMEHILNQLSNSRNPMVIEKAKEYPVLIKYVRHSMRDRHRRNSACISSLGG